MKTYVLFITMFALSCCIVLGKIRNGYEHQLNNSKVALQNLHSELRNAELSRSERRKVKSSIASIENYIRYYQLTEELLRQLKTVCPDIYNEIDTIKDKQGRPTDVYVKLIPNDEANIDLSGATFFQQVPTDKDKHLSEYGEGTVSVKIWLMHNALTVLCHELGHVKYVVPNLATYVNFYRSQYNMPDIKVSYIGHSPFDASGKSAKEFERKFRQRYTDYLNNGGNRLDSALALLQKLRKNHQQLYDIIAAFNPILLSKNYP